MVSLKQSFPSLNTRFVYMIGDEGAILVYMEGDAVVRRLFATLPEPDQVQTFIELLNTHPQTPIYVLVDMIDQSYVRHSLPPVTPLGLNKLVQRRLDRDFAKDDIKGALNLGREKEGRRDWNFLLISLSHTEALKKWLTIVYDLPNRFAGIYLAPVECELIIKRLDAAMGDKNKLIPPENAPAAFTPPPEETPTEEETAESTEGDGGKKKFALKLNKKPKKQKNTESQGTKSQWQVLVSHNKIGGFRQVVLKNGKLIFTRLAQAMNESTPEVLAGNVEQEVLNTIEYLKRLSYNPKNGMDIYIIVSQEIKNAISVARFGATNIHILTPFEASEALKLKQAVLSGDRFGDIVLATTFGVITKKRLRLISDQAKKISTMQTSYTAMKTASALAIVGLTLYGLYQAFSMQSTFSTNSDLEAQLKTKQNNFNALTEESNNLPADVTTVTDMIALNDLISEKQQTPLDMLSDVKSVLEEDPLVRSIQWTANNLVNDGTDKYKGQQIRMIMDLELIYTDESWEAFKFRFDDLMRGFKDAFPDYKISNTNLPGSFQESDKFEINFEDVEAQKGPPPGETFNIDVTIEGPIEKTDDPNKRAS